MSSVSQRADLAEICSQEKLPFAAASDNNPLSRTRGVLTWMLGHARILALTCKGIKDRVSRASGSVRSHGRSCPSSCRGRRVDPKTISQLGRADQCERIKFFLKNRIAQQVSPRESPSSFDWRKIYGIRGRRRFESGAFCERDTLTETASRERFPHKRHFYTKMIRISLFIPLNGAILPIRLEGV